LKRRLLRIAAVLTSLMLLGVFALSKLGSFLVVEDSLRSADAIVVLGGTMYERQMEAVDLYQAGMAPRIYLFREIADWGEQVLIERQVPYLRAVDVQVDAMVKLGVPREAIGILDQAANTASEAGLVRDLVDEQHLSTIIVVTSKQHTRRARLVLSRRLDDLGTTIVMRPSRYDLTPADRWWTDRSTIKFTLFESQSLLGYWLGIAD
jgi:uncharacterized SAM-binding protein YcdF (DUF218 family)